MSGSESSESAGIEELTRQVETLQRQLEKAQAENERLRKELEEALRSLKRQAAPFSRGKRKKKDRNRPGRKSGADYGKQASRPVPERVNEELGISHERSARVLKLGWGLEVNRSALCRAMMRLGVKAAPTYEELRIAVRRSQVNWMDETGWRVAGDLQWLWMCMSAEVTLYDILPGRGFEQAASILGKDWEGWLHHDGWRPYYQFLKAYHQSCLNHLMTRCKDWIEKVSPSAAQFPAEVLELLRKGLDLRDRYARDEISAHGLAVATGRIAAAMDVLLSKTYRTEANRRLAKHLRHEEPWLFTFLHCPGIDATNNAGEREMRPAVIARKTWGGNRSEAGAKTQRTLISVLRTCYRQGRDSLERIVDLLRSPVPIVLDIIPLTRSP